MHVENELVEFVTAGEQEYEEVIEKYEEEVLVQEKVPEPSPTDLANTPPAQVHNSYFELSLDIYV